MAKKKRANKRRRPRRRPKEGVLELQAPKDAMKPLFDVIGDVVSAVETHVRGGMSGADDLSRFQLMAFQRAGNLLKAMKLLGGYGYWELASAGARQLFEMLVNLEYLVSLDDIDEGVRRYLAFGLLQGVRARVSELIYAKGTNRPYDAALLADLESALQSTFMEFGTRRADGGMRWDKSWCGRDTRALAKLSSARIRIHQYDQLFTYWSEETHASPGAFIRGMAVPRTDTELQRTLAREHDRIWHVLVMGYTFVVELWQLLPAITDPTPETTARWGSRLHTFLQDRGEAFPTAPVWPPS